MTMHQPTTLPLPSQVVNSSLSEDESKPTTEPKQNRPAKVFKTIYSGVGFQKGYNFVLYTITVGALFGFVLARLQYLDVDGIFAKNAIPGEHYWYRAGHRRVGIYMHLIGVLLGGFLACLQFTPIIRYKFILFHRINGYLASTLFLIGNAGAFMILDHSVGGTPAMQVWIALLGGATTFGLANALYNIKKLQIDQHRAWMIRTWAWAGNIITLRLILQAAQHVATTYGFMFSTPIRCDEIFYMYASIAGIPDAGNPTGRIYPQCGVDAKTSAVQVLVRSSAQGPEGASASLKPLFLMSAWLAIMVHVLLAELYLWLTPAEHHRLRVLSYKRQVERGLRTPGDRKDAGVSSTWLGDAPAWWSMPKEEGGVGEI